MAKVRTLTNPRWLLAVLLVAANVLVAGVTYRDAQAEPFEDPCTTPGHCQCYDDGSGWPWCSHVMGGEEDCTVGGC